MKKTNKKLSITAESVRSLTVDQLTGIAGGAPPGSNGPGSGCLSCGGSCWGSACTFCACGALTSTCTQYQC